VLVSERNNAGLKKPDDTATYMLKFLVLLTNTARGDSSIYKYKSYYFYHQLSFVFQFALLVPSIYSYIVGKVTRLFDSLRITQ
jgi:hypothetical protein